MTTYKSYAECKIANPHSKIVTTGKNWSGQDMFIGTFEAIDSGHTIGNRSWVICNPADHCLTLKEFFDAGYKLVKGDYLINMWGITGAAAGFSDDNVPNEHDHQRYILSAAALNGGYKIPPKAEQWTVYNNTMPLCELTDEERGLLFNHHCNGGCIQSSQRGGNEEGVFYDIDSWSIWSLNTIYRAKPKSDRELFIEKTTKVMRDAGTKCPDNHEYFGIMFDAGARYSDKTQFFGESI